MKNYKMNDSVLTQLDQYGITARNQFVNRILLQLAIFIKIAQKNGQNSIIFSLEDFLTDRIPPNLSESLRERLFSALKSKGYVLVPDKRFELIL